MSYFADNPCCYSGPDAGWVQAAPFRAWLAHLSDATGFDPLTIAVAVGMPTRVARSLAAGNIRPRRIRAVDALNLISMSPSSIEALGKMLADATPARQSLADLGPWCPDSDNLIRLTGMSAEVASGLLDGWLDVCQKWVVWRCIALAQDITRRRTLAALTEANWCGRPDEPADDFLGDDAFEKSAALAA